jgi:nucleotide-binding universal stress UspA family protein
MYPRILVAIDGSATAERGLQEAIALAGAMHSHLAVLYVVDDYPVLLERATATAFEEGRRHLLKLGEELLAKALAQAREAGVDTECVLREVSSMRAFETILAEVAARHCDLVVMGTHGRRGLSRLTMGSEAEMVLRECPVPVLLVRQPDHGTDSGPKD